MAEFKVVIANPKDKDGKTYKRGVKGSQALSLVGKKIGDEVDGIFLGLPGYKLILTGGSDKDGFPMRRDVPGAKRTKVLVTEGLGFHPERAGQRKRRSMRGNTVSQEIVLLNMKVKSVGGRPLADLLKDEPEEKEKPKGREAAGKDKK